MKKLKKKGQRNRPSPPPAPQAVPMDFQKWRERLRVFVFSTTALMVFCMVYVYKEYLSFDNFFKQVPHVYKVLYLVVVLALPLIKFHTGQAIEVESKRNIEKAKRLVLYRAIFEGVHMILLSVPIVYVSGITNRAASTLNHLVPFLGSRAFNWLLSGLTWLVSGIIGNAGWDLLKKIYKSRQAEAKLHVKGVRARR